MNRLQKAGGCLTLLALPFFCLSLAMYAEPLKGKGRVDSLIPGLFFASVLIVPGVPLFLYGRRVRRDDEFLESVIGMIRSHDRFTVAELAQKIGRTELETEGLVARVIAGRNGVDLVFHRPTRRYIHRARLTAGQRVVDRCASCGAPTQGTVVFEGEHVPCTFCGAPLAAAAAPRR